MSASTRPASRAPGPGAQRPPVAAAHPTTRPTPVKGKVPVRPQSHPDFPETAEIHPLFDEVPRPGPGTAHDPPTTATRAAGVRDRLRRAGALVELVDIQGTPHRVELLDREPGDEARTVLRLAPQGEDAESVRPATVADCGHWYECDCREYGRDWECRHIFALIRIGLLSDPLAAGRTRSGEKGGESCS